MGKKFEELISRFSQEMTRSIDEIVKEELEKINKQREEEREKKSKEEKKILLEITRGTGSTYLGFCGVFNSEEEVHAFKVEKGGVFISKYLPRVYIDEENTFSQIDVFGRLSLMHRPKYINKRVLIEDRIFYFNAVSYEQSMYLNLSYFNHGDLEVFNEVFLPIDCDVLSNSFSDIIGILYLCVPEGEYLDVHIA